MIALENINVNIGENKIIKDLTYEFKKGKITTLIGPNGSGKSTLLKSIMGVVPATTGVIKLCNKDIRAYSRKDKSKLMTMMFQYNKINDSMTVSEMVRFGRIPHTSFIKGLDKDDEEKIEESIQSMGIKDIENKKLYELSGGQMQRVFLATCLCQEPQILLLDEPTNHLDVKYQLELLNLVKEINEKHKLTVILVLHDINLAIKYSDDIIVMKDGQIYDHGPSKNIVTEKIINDVFGVQCSIQLMNNEHLIQYL